MKKISLKNLIVWAFCLFMVNGLSAQIILDYETAGTTFGFGSFGGATYVGASPNPDATGINTSATVGEYFEGLNPPDPQCWAGIVGSPGNRLDFVNYSNACVKVWAPSTGNLLFKVEQANMGGTWEQLQPINVANEWVEICFDGTQPDAASGGAPAVGRDFGAVVLFFDFACGTGIPDPPASDKTWYFDDIRMDGPPPPPMNTYDVTFRVNMNGYAGVWNDVFVSGTFNGWSGNADQLTDPDGDGIYEKVITMPSGPIIYKFQLNQWWKQEYFAAGASCAIDNAGNWDRTFDVTDNVVLPAYCYSSCVECPTSTVPTRQVTFSVNMNNHPDPFTTPFFSGSYNWWSQFENPLSDIDGDGIWETTIQFVEGQASAYKFQLDGWVQQEFFNLGDPCTFNNFGNADRIYVAGADDEVLPTYCYSTCDICPAIVVPTMGEWAVFILALLMIAVGAVFMLGMENKKVLATSSGTAAVGGTMKSLPFDKGNFFKAIKHAIGLAVVGFGGIYLGWGEIVFADLVGMFISVPIFAYIIHLFYKK